MGLSIFITEFSGDYQGSQNIDQMGLSFHLYKALAVPISLALLSAKLALTKYMYTVLNWKLYREDKKMLLLVECHRDNTTKYSVINGIIQRKGKKL